MARKNAVVTYTVNENGTLTFSAGGQSVDFDPSAQSDENSVKARNYGYAHKITLGAAIAKEDLPSDAGEAALAKFNGMKAVIERLNAGEWSMRGQGGGQPSGVIFRAYEEWVQGQAAKKNVEAPSSEKIRSIYDAKTRAEQLALRNVSAVAKIIERLKSEAGGEKTTVDAAALLDEVFA